MKSILKKAFNCIGLDIVKDNRSFYKAEITDLDSPDEAVYSRKYIVFEIPVQKCVYPCFLSYDPAGWHHFTKTLEEYAGKESIHYNKSILKNYYERFQATTQYDLYFDFSISKLEMLCPRLLEYPLNIYKFLQPWDLTQIKLAGEKSLSHSHGNQAFGPVSPRKLELEYNRLVKAFHSIRKNGYGPHNGDDGEITGYFLKDSEDYRFMIRSGYHRTAVLSVLGYKKIRATFSKYCNRKISIKDIHNWPQVKNGLFDKKIAEMIFMRYFLENGRERARNLGLIR